MLVPQNYFFLLKCSYVGVFIRKASQIQDGISSPNQEMIHSRLTNDLACKTTYDIIGDANSRSCCAQKENNLETRFPESQANSLTIRPLVILEIDFVSFSFFQKNIKGLFLSISERRKMSNLTAAPSPTAHPQLVLVYPMATLW